MHKEVGDFVLCFPLTDGNTSDVFFAHSKLAPIPVAIKIIQKCDVTNFLDSESDDDVFRGADQESAIESNKESIEYENREEKHQNINNFENNEKNKNKDLNFECLKHKNEENENEEEERVNNNISLDSPYSSNSAHSLNSDDSSVSEDSEVETICKNIKYSPNSTNITNKKLILNPKPSNQSDSVNPLLKLVNILNPSSYKDCQTNKETSTTSVASTAATATTINKTTNTTCNLQQKTSIKTAKNVVAYPKDFSLSSKIATARRRQKALNEIEIMRSIDHPNIISIFDTVEETNTISLVMEYADNGNLLNYLVPGRPQNEAQARNYFTQIVGALYYLHDVAKVAHRDIKAENILLDSNFHVKLSDFGLSRRINVPTPKISSNSSDNTVNTNVTLNSSGNNLLKTQCGSPLYVSPEILKNKEYGLQVDIWSAGVLLYLMVTGYFPFEDRNLPLLFKKILNDPVKCPDFLSDDLKDLLERMLTKNPEDRIDIYHITCHPWISNQSPKKSISLPSLNAGPSKSDMIGAVSLELEKYGITQSEVLRRIKEKDKTMLVLFRIVSKKVEERQRKRIPNGTMANGQVRKKIPMMGRTQLITSACTVKLPMRQEVIARPLISATRTRNPSVNM